jgi:DNA-binding NtrC family response regulator
MEKMGAPLRAPPTRSTKGVPLVDEIKALERQRIVEALEACNGNQTRAAEMLGVPRAKLGARLDEFGIARPRKPKT